MTGYSLDWIAYDLGISKRRIYRWIEKRLLRGPGIRAGRGYRHDPEFLFCARQVRDAYDLWPHGPADNIRDLIDERCRP